MLVTACARLLFVPGLFHSRAMGEQLEVLDKETFARWVTLGCICSSH